MMTDPKCFRALCAVLRLKLVEVIAMVLMASCVMGCDCSCCFVMFRKRVEGNPKCVEKLLSNSSLLSRASWIDEK